MTRSFTFRCSHVASQLDKFGEMTVHLNTINSLPHSQGFIALRLAECDFVEGELYRVVIEEYDEEAVMRGLQ